MLQKTAKGGNGDWGLGPLAGRIGNSLCFKEALHAYQMREMALSNLLKSGKSPEEIIRDYNSN